MAEWLKAADCKSVLIWVRRFESFPAHQDKFSSNFLEVLIQLNFKISKILMDTKILNRFKRNGLFLTQNIEKGRFLWYYVTYN